MLRRIRLTIAATAVIYTATALAPAPAGAAATHGAAVHVLARGHVVARSFGDTYFTIGPVRYIASGRTWTPHVFVGREQLLVAELVHGTAYFYGHGCVVRIDTHHGLIKLHVENATGHRLNVRVRADRGQT